MMMLYDDVSIGYIKVFFNSSKADVLFQLFLRMIVHIKLDFKADVLTSVLL
jgi:hypothetical protein